VPHVRGSRLDLSRVLHMPEVQGSSPRWWGHYARRAWPPRACRTYRARRGTRQALSALLASAGWWLSNTYLNDAVTGTTEWFARSRITPSLSLS
jgi:hypothetical protein